MRCLHLRDSLDPRMGGSVTALRNISFGEAELGNDVTIVCTTNCASAVAERHAAIEVIAFPLSKPRILRISFGLAFWFWSHCREFDLVQFHEVWSPNAVIAAAVCRFRRVPYVLRPHGSLDPFDLKKHAAAKVLLGWTLFGTVVRGAAGLVFTTTREAEKAIGFGSSAPRTVVHLPVPAPADQGSDVDEVHESPCATADELRLVYLGRIDYKKGLTHLLRAIAELRDTRIKLNIIGDGIPSFVREVQSYAEQLGLGAQVRFLGFLTGAEKRAALKAADWFVLLSDNENYALSVVEALTEGVPVILSSEVYIVDELPASRAVIVTTPNARGGVLALREAMARRDDRGVDQEARDVARALGSCTELWHREQQMRECVVASQCQGPPRRDLE